MAGRGRPSKFPANQDRIKELVESGKTEAQVADILGVSTRTFDRWKESRRDFRRALKDWKAVADGEVEISLYDRACGYMGPDGKYYPPSDTACIFWLKNRKKDEWRDKQEIEHSGDAFKQLTDEQLKEEIKRLAQGLGTFGPSLTGDGAA